MCIKRRTLMKELLKHSILMAALMSPCFLLVGSAQGAPKPGSVTVTSPDGKIVATASDKSISFYDAKTQRELVRILAHSAPVTALAFSPDGKKVVSGSLDKIVMVFDAATGKAILQLRGHQAAITAVKVSANGRTLTSASADKFQITWDLATGKVVKQGKGK
jgi:WD40 repeat protein